MLASDSSTKDDYIFMCLCCAAGNKRRVFWHVLQITYDRSRVPELVSRDGKDSATVEDTDLKKNTPVGKLGSWRSPSIVFNINSLV